MRLGRHLVSDGGDRGQSRRRQTGSRAVRLAGHRAFLSLTAALRRTRQCCEVRHCAGTAAALASLQGRPDPDRLSVRPIPRAGHRVAAACSNGMIAPPSRSSPATAGSTMAARPRRRITHAVAASRYLRPEQRRAMVAMRAQGIDIPVNLCGYYRMTVGICRVGLDPQHVAVPGPHGQCPYKRYPNRVYCPILLTLRLHFATFASFLPSPSNRSGITARPGGSSRPHMRQKRRCSHCVQCGA